VPHSLGFARDRLFAESATAWTSENLRSTAIPVPWGLPAPAPIQGEAEVDYPYESTGCAPRAISALTYRTEMTKRTINFEMRGNVTGIVTY
jgi:hypothetical protein